MVDYNPKLLADTHWYVPEALQTQIGLIDTNTALAAGGGYRMVRKTLTFTGGAGLGAVGAVALFTVTGGVAFRLTAICTTDLTPAVAGATFSVGTAAAVAGILAATLAADIDTGDIWFAAVPATVLDTIANAEIPMVIGNGAAIQGDVAVQAISSGVIAFTLLWRPLTANGNIVAA